MMANESNINNTGVIELIEYQYVIRIHNLEYQNIDNDFLKTTVKLI